jgi:3-hydroxyisobutyryl-CoA hydrolase
MTIFEVLSMEYDLVSNFVGKQISNFALGVSHKLVDKKKGRPEWSPATIYDVSDELVEYMFENLEGPWLYPR